MIAFWTGAGGWIVVMYGALNTSPRPRGGRAHRRRRARQIALRLKMPLIRKWIVYMADPRLRDRDAVLRRAAAGAQASLGLVPDTWSSNQLAYDFAFRYADFNGAAAISVDLVVSGLVAAVSFVTRTGLFRTED